MPRKCKSEGCGKWAQQGGVCVAHGAKLKRCSFAGCDRHIVQGGLCIAHGAKKKRCIVPGCSKHVFRRGVCRAHVVGLLRCQAVDCRRYVIKGHNTCSTHTFTRRCGVEGCRNYAAVGGICSLHTPQMQKCSIQQCKKWAKVAGQCIGHSRAELAGDSERRLPSPTANRGMASSGGSPGATDREDGSTGSYTFSSPAGGSASETEPEAPESPYPTSEDSRHGSDEDVRKAYPCGARMKVGCSAYTRFDAPTPSPFHQQWCVPPQGQFWLAPDSYEVNGRVSMLNHWQGASAVVAGVGGASWVR